MLFYIFCTFILVNQILAEVVVENLKEWNRELRREGVVLAHFRTKWCSPCNRLEREWDRVQQGPGLQKFQNSFVSTVTIDCTENEEICKRYNVESFPCIFSFCDGNKILKLDDDQPRTTESFLKFAQASMDFFHEKDEGVAFRLKNKEELDFVKKSNYDTLNVLFTQHYDLEAKEKFEQVMEQVNFALSSKTRFVVMDLDLVPKGTFNSKPLRIPADKAWVVSYQNGVEKRRQSIDDFNIGDMQVLRKLEVEAEPLSKIIQKRVEAETPPGELIEGVKMQPEEYLYIQLGESAELSEARKTWEKRNDHAWTDICNRPGEFCWTLNDDGECQLNEDCISVDCSDDVMKIEVDNDLLKTDENYEIRLLSGVDEQSCINFAKFYQDNKARKSFLSIPYGDCGMSVTSSKREDDSPTITFEQIVRFDTLDISFKLNAKCNIGAEVTLKPRLGPNNSDYFNVETKEFDHTNSVNGDWGQLFELMFFQDENFSIKSDRNNLMVGEQINVAVYLANQNLKGVKFFIERCFMANSENMFYDIIRGGCISELVSGRFAKNNPYQEEDQRFSFRSFSFRRTASLHQMNFNCVVKICPQSEIDNGKCGIKNSCSDGYKFGENWLTEEIDETTR